jgi:hypothetical protein
MMTAAKRYTITNEESSAYTQSKENMMLTLGLYSAFRDVKHDHLQVEPTV